GSVLFKRWQVAPGGWLDADVARLGIGVQRSQSEASALDAEVFFKGDPCGLLRGQVGDRRGDVAAVSGDAQAIRVEWMNSAGHGDRKHFRPRIVRATHHQSPVQTANADEVSAVGIYAFG